MPLPPTLISTPFGDESPEAVALVQQLQQLDGRGYKAYHCLRGSYRFADFTLIMDRIQADPFAQASQCRVLVPQHIAGFVPGLYANRSRQIGLRDFLTRQLYQAAGQLQQRLGSGNSGLLAIAPPGPEILERSSVLINDQQVEARLRVGLPARGRRIDGSGAVRLLCEQIPQLVRRCLHYAALSALALEQHIQTNEDADWIRQQLPQQGWVAFIADGSILPRSSRLDPSPLAGAIPFQSPDSLRVALDCPHQGRVTGLGLPVGITLIVGGGYHGKSTLLHALETGVYNHIPGDGREGVITQADAVKIRAEEGRPITQVDLSPFINHLPQGQSTTEFSTANASGSTSQAANIIEALELGAQVLLMDEDTTATNLMIRDRRMQALITPAQEPITPFIDQIRPLYTHLGVSSILVMGGSGDYFEVADTAIAMTDYQPQDVTTQAWAIAAQYPSDRTCAAPQPLITRSTRHLTQPPGLFAGQDRPPKIKIYGLDKIILGPESIDLTQVEQLVESGQLSAIAAAMLYLHQQCLPSDLSMADLIQQLMTRLDLEGLSMLSTLPTGDLVAFRRFELGAALNRWRTFHNIRSNLLSRVSRR